MHSPAHELATISRLAECSNSLSRLSQRHVLVRASWVQQWRRYVGDAPATLPSSSSNSSNGNNNGSRNRGSSDGAAGEIVGDEEFFMAHSEPPDGNTINNNSYNSEEDGGDGGGNGWEQDGGLECYNGKEQLPLSEFLSLVSALGQEKEKFELVAKIERELRGPVVSSFAVGTRKMGEEDENGAVLPRGERPGPLEPILLLDPPSDDVEFIPYECWRAFKAWYGVKALNGESAGKRGDEDMCGFIVKTSIPEHWNVLTSWDDFVQSATTNDSLQRCWNCLSSGNGVMLQCSGCMHAMYCSEACSATHWPFHQCTKPPVSGRSLGNFFLATSSLDMDMEDDDDPYFKPLQYNIDSFASSSRYGSNTTLINSPIPYHGRVGLRNLGNTCFMNSTVQCLSRLWPLTRYFLRGDYQIDLGIASKTRNRNNAVSHQWCILLQNLWHQRQHSSFSPLGFKDMISSLPDSLGRFAGNMQQDAQELLVFLLDALHEDLGIIASSPTKYKEPNGDARKLADIAWENQLCREQSIIDHLFQGQIQSVLCCPQCNYQSFSHESFRYLPLAFPETTVHFTIIKQQREGAPPAPSPILVPCQVNKYDTCLAILQKISEVMEIPQESIWLVQIENGRVVKEFLESTPGSEILAIPPDGQGFIAAYELIRFTDRDRDISCHCVAMHRGPNHNTGNHSAESRIHGLPIVVSFPERRTRAEVRRRIASTAMSMMTLPSSVSLLNSTTRMKTIDYIAETVPMQISNTNGAFTEGSPSKSSNFISDSQTAIDHDNLVFLTIDWSQVPGIFEPIMASCNGIWTEIQAHRKKNDSLNLSIQTCLEYFLKDETLDKKNTWCCPRCQTNQQAIKRTTIARAPNILVLFLKRNASISPLRQYQQTQTKKIKDRVTFPLRDFDFSPFMRNLSDSSGTIAKKKVVYDLFAVTNHYGTSGYGHYTAFVAEGISNSEPARSWVEMDDDKVNPILGEERVISDAAYVCYYRNRQA